jgi:glycosyltransferase 2 family protein
LAAAILALVIRAVPLGEVARRTREAAPGPLLLALVLAGAASLLLAFRLWLLAQALGLSPTLGTAAGVNLSALFYGLFLPGGNVTGGAIRFYRLAGPGRRVTAAAGAIAWDRLSATLALCLVGLTCWLFAPHPKPSWPALVFALGIAATLGIMALGVSATGGESSVSPSTGGDTNRLRQMARAIRSGLREVARLKISDHAAALGLSIAVQILGTAIYAALAGALGVRISPLTIGWIRAAVMLVLLLPITISGLGVREGTLMVLLTAEGVGQAPAFALGMLVFGATVLAPALVGGVSEGIRFIRAYQ